LFHFTNDNYKPKQLIRGRGLIDELGWECQDSLSSGFADILGKNDESWTKN
jgi:hypothetical protein